MSVISVGARSALMVQSLVQMRAQLDDLNRQLGTGQKSTTYAGLGLDRGMSVTLNARLSAISGYSDTITMVGTRLDLAQTTLSRMATITQNTKAAVSKSTFDPDSLGQTTAQKTAMASLSEFLSLLNTQVGDRYMFSGSATDAPSVDTLDHILNGDGGKAGLKDVIAQRQQADLGADGLGRLVLSAPTARSVAVAEDAANSPFGFKLSGISSSIAGATVSGPSGSPAAVSLDLGSANAVAGDTVRVAFTLPDGTSENVTLTATTANPPGANQFTIGATPDDTAANIKAALTASVGKLAATALTAASAIAAGNDFFNTDATHPPQRIDPPYATATALRDGTPADTVVWYTGEDGSGPARATATAAIDQSISVSYGTRANEEGIRYALQNLAVAAVTTYSAGDPDAAAKNTAMQQRLLANLDTPPGVQSIQTIQSELAGAQASLKAASTRHQQTAATLQGLQEQITGVSNEEVGSQILALQTRLSASLQTTAKLYQLSLVNFL